MKTTVDEHREQAPHRVHCAVLTVSDTRTLDTDVGGQTVVTHLEQAGHHIVDRRICPDEPERMTAQLRSWVEQPQLEVILLTGGTGISSRDQTYETVCQLMTKPLPGYGELFRWLSFQEIGPAAMLSRAVGGLIDATVILTMPGSPSAVKLAMEQLVVPEISHLVQQASKHS